MKPPAGVRIASVGVAQPPYTVEQHETARWVARETGDARRAVAIARGSQIARRSFVIPGERIAALGSTQARNEIYRELAPGLAAEAASAALGPHPAQHIDALITSSCTGYMVPGWALDLITGLGLRNDISRTPITEAGCAGGVVGLARAADYLLARRTGTALVVATELCSLAYQRATHDDAVTANMLFADGAGAALVAYGDGPGLHIRDMASVLVPASRDLLGFELTDRGFSPIISRDLVEAVAPAVTAAATAMLARNELSPRDVAAWLIHPGGARILGAIEHTLATAAGATRWSWNALNDSGNTSSAAIFDVVDRYLRDPHAPGGTVMLVGLGPGVSIELVLATHAC